MAPLTAADHEAINRLYEWAMRKRDRHIALHTVRMSGGGDVGWWVELSRPDRNNPGTPIKIYQDGITAATEVQREDNDFASLEQVIDAAIGEATNQGW